MEYPQPEMGTNNDVLGARIGAAVIDFILLAIIGGALGFALGSAGATIGNLLGLVIWLAYYIYFEANYGQTIGKMALNIVVVTEDGGQVDYEKAVLRNVLRIVDAFPFLYLVGIVVIVLSDENQRLGDIVADTLVVRSR